MIRIFVSFLALFTNISQTNSRALRQRCIINKSKTEKLVVFLFRQLNEHKHPSGKRSRYYQPGIEALTLEERNMS
ncbi:hypothetical protein PRNP1_013112 [Phytophthora ramorum]